LGFVAGSMIEQVETLGAKNLRKSVAKFAINNKMVQILQTNCFNLNDVFLLMTFYYTLQNSWMLVAIGK
jgi:hypothetical protein